MFTSRRLAAALVSALLLTGLTACADRSAEVAPPVAVEPSQKPSPTPALASTVDVQGSIQQLSSGSADGVYMLRVADGGYLAIAAPEGMKPPLRQAGVVIAVPADFDTTLTGAELYAALLDLGEVLGEPLTVVEFLEISPR